MSSSSTQSQFLVEREAAPTTQTSIVYSLAQTHRLRKPDEFSDQSSCASILYEWRGLDKIKPTVLRVGLPVSKCVLCSSPGSFTMRQLASVAVVALLTLSLWPECSATAPSQAHPASLLNFRRHRTGHKREDEPQKEHVDVPPTGSDGETAATDEVPRSIRRMQQRVLKEMFQVDILAEEDRLDHNPDVQSNYLLNLYNDIANNETGELKAMRKGKQPLLTETVGSYPILGE